ncbi:OLC1v1006567C1 [Oldenlandia corymbosa var. corymbosa]|uniref:Glycosyltransferase n=1 Tax=Oldenlandia corymbosa var. corymbosa TaxID=529605 RepID=A0AAV1DJR5_OLDCO|nr:OLC1v1006567C1 [Oldenlandia corymbosa var. corymbosa]
MASNTKVVHALVLPYPSQGHINPLLQFCKRLVSKGAKATFVNSVFLSKSMHADPKSSINFETISDGYDEGGWLSAESAEIYLDNLRTVGSKTLSELIKKLQDNGQVIDVVIYDSFLTWALDVAKEFGIVAAAFFTQTCAVNSVYYHVYNGLLPVPLSGSPVSLPELPVLQPEETPSFVYRPEDNPAFRDLLVNQFCNVDQTDWVFLNIFDKLEENLLNWMGKLWRRVRTVGPTVPSMYLDKRLADDTGYGIHLSKPESSLCMNWLNRQETGSVVYVSFGSWSQINEVQIEEIASALKQSGFKFLWVVRAFEKEKLPKTFTEETSDQGLVVTWSPQLEVLAHESLGCFVTHCGFNSVLEALCLGVPMVAAPVWTDQPTNAKLIEDVWGVGIRTKKDEQGIVRKESLVSCLEEIMEEGSEKGKLIKENAAKWKNLAKEAIDEGGSSDKNIDDFLADLAS